MHQTKPHPRTQNSKRLSYPIILIVGLAFAFNLQGLAVDSFWGDEIFTASFASRSIPEVIRWTADDIHPPLYYLFARTFTRLTVPLGLTIDPTAASDWLWRFPSVVAVTLTVAVTYRLTSYVFRIPSYQSQSTRPTLRSTHYAATAAAFLLTLAPIAIKYGQEARMHALFMFLSALATWLFFRALAKPERWPRWLVYGLVTAANIYTMYFGFLILAAHAALLGFSLLDLQLMIDKAKILDGNPSIINPQSKGHEQLRRYAGQVLPVTSYPIRKSQYALLLGFSLATVLTVILYGPWWPVLFNLLRKRAIVGAIEGGVGSPLTFLTGVVQALGPHPTPVAWGFLALFMIGLSFLAQRTWPIAAFGALWLALPMVLPIFLGDPRALQFRYAFILPIYLTIIVYAVVNLSLQLQQKTANFQLAGHKLAITNNQSLNLPCYLVWLLATLSFIATLGIYAQTKPNWRDAAAYLTEHTKPADLIVVAPLWDEGRFIEYYYRGQAPLLTPAALVTNIQGRAEGLRAGGGEIWAVSRFVPAESAASKNIQFSGVVIAEPQVAVYEPDLLAQAALDLASQAVDAAYPWAAEAEAQGVLNPDPRTAQAVALRALGDGLVAAGRSQEALEPYQTAVDIFPGWVNGYLALAETQEAVGNLAAAAQAYQQAVAFNLEWHGALADEATQLVESGQWAAALEKYHQFVGD